MRTALRRSDDDAAVIALSTFLFAAVMPQLEGRWQAETAYPVTSTGVRGSMAIQAGTPDYPASVAVPAGSKLERAEHLELWIRSDGSQLKAFVRNPEQNAGAALGERSVTLAGSKLVLRRDGAPDVDGSWRTQTPGELTLTNPGLPGTFRFVRVPVPASGAYTYSVPQDRDDGWNAGTLASAGIDERAIAHIVGGIRSEMPSSPRSPYVQSLLVARHGKLVLDEYFNGFDAERPHDVRSAGKSVTTLLVGRAIEDGVHFSPESKIASILASYAPFANDDARKQAITVGDLMSMSAGYACDDNDDASPGNEDRMQSQTAQPDWYRYTLNLPMLFTPGSRALYCSAEINLLGAIVALETKQWLPEYFDARFAKPMQFKTYGMWLVPPPVSDAYMAGGDFFRPRDFLKFGQLFLNGGRWNGHPIVNAAWLDDVSRRHSYVEDGGGDYGYGWHLAQYDRRGRSIRAVYAAGNGGQLLYVFPELDLTVMVTAGNYGQFPIWRTFETQLIPQILDAVD